MESAPMRQRLGVENEPTAGAGARLSQAARKAISRLCSRAGRTNQPSALDRRCAWEVFGEAFRRIGTQPHSRWRHHPVVVERTRSALAKASDLRADSGLGNTLTVATDARNGKRVLDLALASADEDVRSHVSYARPHGMILAFSSSKRAGERRTSGLRE